jgi:hypothetical protein
MYVGFVPQVLRTRMIPYFQAGEMGRKLPEAPEEPKEPNVYA